MEIRPAGRNFEIHGDTYLVKDILKRHGARWDGFRSVWAFDSEAKAQAALAEAAPTLAMRKELEELEAA